MNSPRAKRPARTCDAPGCAVIVPRGKLMCRDHWFAVPRPLRQAITESWREKRIRDWSANCLEARNYHARLQRERAQSTLLESTNA